MEFENIYFLGIGGIGMSALARYFLHEGKEVAGYDLKRTPLTVKLEQEGAKVHYRESVDEIPVGFRNPDRTLVVYTPAVPTDHAELLWFRENGFTIEKRADMLGHISRGKYVMAVAGTHGKTSVTTLVAWLNHRAAKENVALCNDGRERTITVGGGSAFLGGISVNFNTNLVLGSGDRLAVEADEFDRSFLRLNPNVAVVTSADADHLDIYGTHDAVKQAFSQFIAQIKPHGALILKHGVELDVTNSQIDVYRYSLDVPCNFYASNMRLIEDGRYEFDVNCPDGVIEGCRLGVPGIVNVENAVAAVAMMWVAGFEESKLKQALEEFRGVKRRMEVYVSSPTSVYIDDYAHHPQELRATLGSIRSMFPGRRITAVFQPHLYSRTKDLYVDFAAALSAADEVWLLPIYPAREKPMAGIDSELIGSEISVPWRIVEKQNLVGELAKNETDIVVTFGAGDIGDYCDEIAGIVARK